MRFVFSAQLWRWQARTEDWYFVSVPAPFAAEIAEIPRMRRGFGAVRVEAVVGATRWRTSIFPFTADDERVYVLPMKAAVRRAEQLVPDGACQVELTVLEG